MLADQSAGMTPEGLVTCLLASAAAGTVLDAIGLALLYRQTSPAAVPGSKIMPSRRGHVKLTPPHRRRDRTLLPFAQSVNAAHVA